MIKILVVEDELEVAQLIRNALNRGFDCQVSESFTGDDAVSLMLKEEFDLVILDIKMPGKNGLDVIREVKNKKQLPAIIVVTGHDSDQVLQEAIDLGVSHYMVKPLDFAKFNILVRTILIQLGKCDPKKED